MDFLQHDEIPEYLPGLKEHESYNHTDKAYEEAISLRKENCNEISPKDLSL